MGEQIAHGKTIKEITGNMHIVVEGIQTTRAAVELGEEYGIELPITEAIYKILFEDMSPLEGIQELMNRRPTSE